MKKFLGVLVAITLCACMLVPMASATEGDLISDIFAGIDLGELSEADLNAIISDLGLEGIDVQAILNGDADALAKLEDAVSGATGEETTAAQASGSTTTDDLSGVLGDLSSGDMDSLIGGIGDAFSGAGVDLENAAPGSDVAGQVDSNNMMAGLMDSIFGTLESLGIDTSMIEGMLDNEIVNFFANMYIGYVGQVEEETTAAPETTTKKPVVVTTKTPDTGDTSAVFAALATITVASAAAFVCLKKKEN